MLKLKIGLSIFLLSVWCLFFRFYTLARGAIESEASVAQLNGGTAEYVYSRFMIDSGMLTVVTLVCFGIPALMWIFHFYKTIKEEVLEIK